MSQTEQKRQVYRIKYPDSDRPRLVTSLGSFEVVDCSEAGMRFQLAGAAAPLVTSAVTGRVTFGMGETAEVAGFVLRVDGNMVAVRFTRSLPTWIMLREQRWLRERAAQQALAAAAK
jgi:hypothetical protein